VREPSLEVCELGPGRYGARCNRSILLALPRGTPVAELVVTTMKTKRPPTRKVEDIDPKQLDAVVGGCACGCGQADCNCANGSCQTDAARQWQWR